MRRIGFGVFALALTLGSASLVSAQQAPQGQQPQRGQWQGHRQHARGAFGQRGQKALFKDVKLTDQEKAQIKQIRQKYQAQAKELRQSLRPAAQQGQAQGERRARPAFDRNSPQFQQMRSLREQEMREVRAVLTPDQQRTFDRNLAELKTRMEQHAQKRGERQGK